MKFANYFCWAVVVFAVLLCSSRPAHAESRPTHKSELYVTPHANLTGWQCLGDDVHAEAIIDVYTNTSIGASWDYGYYTFTYSDPTAQHVEVVIMVPTGNTFTNLGPRWHMDEAQSDEPITYHIPHEAHFAWKYWDTTDQIQECN